MKIVPVEVPPQPNRLKSARSWYAFAYWLLRCLCWLFFRRKSQGGENVPPTGGCLVASNHVSFLDPPLVGISAYREMHYFARKSLFSVWWLRPMIASVNTIPVDLGNVDLTGVRNALRLLSQGKALVVFPEGTRSHDGNLQEPLAGVGMLVARSGVPVVPVRIFGAEKAWPRQKKLFRPFPVFVKFGQPIRFELSSEEAKSRDTYLTISREIMRRIAELQPPS